MKLEVGMYVRTENGVIEKVKRIYDRHTADNVFVWLNTCGDGQIIFVDDFEEIKFRDLNSGGFIKKEPSFNIIDLIEVGDVITTNNLCGQVTYIEGNKIYTTCYDREYCYDYQIQSIVTKEQFESVQYKVGE